MRLLLYVSNSLIGCDTAALDQLLVQARTNNALDGVTGLLWTDGKRFAQVLEGGEFALSELLMRLRADPRHADLQVLEERELDQRLFGDWSMVRPATEVLAEVYEQRLLRYLARLDGDASDVFKQVIAGSRKLSPG